MKLKEYNRKRNFTKTPEPVGKKNRTKSLRFYIQKHDASHLHYDFRLELDGALKSWAIPKGPSLDPSQKRLAVMVEDHPLEYGEFEGTIPAGNYGAGLVEVWDKGVYSSSGTDDLENEINLLRKGLKKGHLKLLLYGNRLKGGFNLIRLKSDSEKNWLLVKEKDEFASFEKEEKKVGNKKKRISDASQH